MTAAGTIRSHREADVAGKRVLVRVDFNVPLDAGRIRDETRITSALPTLRSLLGRGASLVLVSHLGRPKGKPSKELRLAPVAARLGELLAVDVARSPEVVGLISTTMAEGLEPGGILMLENVRFEPGEEKNAPELARRLATLADLYVDDAFGAAHRAHASTVGIAEHLPAYAGDLLLAEIQALGRLVDDPASPFVAVVGGAKVSDKLAVLQRLVERVDALLIGGAMANTFLLADGKSVGESLVEPAAVDAANAIVDSARQRGVQLLIPTDVVVATSMDSPDGTVVAVDNITGDTAAYDIGPATAERYASVISTARTVFWNGPMGVFEKAPFATGTLAVARAVAAGDAFSVVGGGDSVAAVTEAGVADQISHISTGGGASLEFVEGRALPGVEALRRS